MDHPSEFFIPTHFCAETEAAKYFKTSSSTGHCHKIQNFRAGAQLMMDKLKTLKSPITY
jgi:hypothetical protein